MLIPLVMGLGFIVALLILFTVVSGTSRKRGHPSSADGSVAYMSGGGGDCDGGADAGCSDGGGGGDGGCGGGGGD